MLLLGANPDNLSWNFIESNNNNTEIEICSNDIIWKFQIIHKQVVTILSNKYGEYFQNIFL